MSFRKIQWLGLILAASFFIARTQSIGVLIFASFYLSTESIAQYGLWLSVSLLGSIFVTARLEQQIVGALKKTARILFSSACWLALLICLVAFVLAIVFQMPAFWSGIILAIFMRATRDVLNMWSVRNRKISRTAVLSMGEAGLRFTLTVLLCLYGARGGWVLPVIDLIALAFYIIFWFSTMPFPPIKSLGPITTFKQMMQLKAKTWSNAFSNLMSAMSETLLIQFPILSASMLASDEIAATIFLVQRIGEGVTRLVSSTVSTIVFRRFAALRTAALSVKKSLVLKTLFVSFLIALIGLVGTYFVLVLCTPLLNPIWKQTVPLFPVAALFFLIIATVGPLFRLFTLYHQEHLSLVANGLGILIGGGLAIVLLITGLNGVWIFAALALGGMFRAAFVLYSQKFVLKASQAPPD